MNYSSLATVYEDSSRQNGSRTHCKPLVEVQQRDANTLLVLIAQYIHPGIVYSNEWSLYNQLSATTGLAHQTVNHSLPFVDPISGAHTQGVEAMWSSCKGMLREERTMHSKLFVTYLPEFMWRRKFGGPSTFSNILKHIVEQFHSDDQY